MQSIFTAQNVVLEVSKFEPPVLEAIPDQKGLWLLLVNLLDPQNLGSIIRSASYFGAAGLITTLKHSVDYTPIVSKASAGAMESFSSLYRCKSPLEFLKVNTRSLSHFHFLEF